MTVTATKEIRFCAAHRLLGHEGQCASLHGHNYRVMVTVERVAQHLDEVGRVLDFAHIKADLKRVVVTQWDHAVLVWENDVDLLAAMAPLSGKVTVVPFNATAEGMALFLLHRLDCIMRTDYGVTVRRVQVWETETAYAEAFNG